MQNAESEVRMKNCCGASRASLMRIDALHGLDSQFFILTDSGLPEDGEVDHAFFVARGPLIRPSDTFSHGEKDNIRDCCRRENADFVLLLPAGEGGRRLDEGPPCRMQDFDRKN